VVDGGGLQCGEEFEQLFETVHRPVIAVPYRALFDALADQDINRIVAGIAQPNLASNALHERFGFKSIGVFSQVGRKFGRFWDVMWMERPLKLL
jgi:phosphinothricin acetyltransferase